MAAWVMTRLTHPEVTPSREDHPDPSGPRHFASNFPYNHHSMLRTTEDAWDLPELGFTSDHAQVTRMNEFLTR